MEYFDKFWAEAKQNLSNNEPQKAAQSLRFGIQASELESDNKRLTQLAEALSQIGQQMALPELHKRASAAKKFHHQAFSELGYELIEVGLPDIAVPSRTLMTLRFLTL